MWQASNFSLQSLLDQTYKLANKENDHQTWNFLMFVQILPTSTLRNIWRTQRRICILILGLEGLTSRKLAGQWQIHHLTRLKRRRLSLLTYLVKIDVCVSCSLVISQRSHIVVDIRDDNIPLEVYQLTQQVNKIWHRFMSACVGKRNRH